MLIFPNEEWMKINHYYLFLTGEIQKEELFLFTSFVIVNG